MTQSYYTLQSFIAILTEVLPPGSVEITSESTLVDDLFMDSLSMAEAAALVKQRFGIQIPEAEFAEFGTVGRAVAYIEAQIGSADGSLHEGRGSGQIEV